MMHLGLALVIGGVVLFVAAFFLGFLGAFSAPFASRAAALEVCKRHEGRLGQGSGTRCGTMVGDICRKGVVDATRTECTVPPNRAVELAYVVAGVLVLAGVVTMARPTPNQKRATKR